jgi:1-acyl-sn-glycerol-3-phosphate acyltransferase
MSIASPPGRVSPRGSLLARRLLGWLGWQLHFDGLPSAQGVIVVYPHTSNWDFPVGLLAKWAMGFDAHFLGKHTLFRIPLFGAWLRWIGGVPVDRAGAQGVVGQMVELLQAKKAECTPCWLAITPEGTRSWRPAWRSGFYRLALAAQVPVGLAVLDFGRKQVRLADFVSLSGEVEADMARIARGFDGALGCRPALAAPIRLDAPKDDA